MNGLASSSAGGGGSGGGGGGAGGGGGVVDASTNNSNTPLGAGGGGIGNNNNSGFSSSSGMGITSERSAILQERISGVGGCQSSSTGAVLTSANSVASSSGGGGGGGASSSSASANVGGAVAGTGSPIRGRGCPTGLPASMIGSCGGAGDAMLRKSRSQGGKKLQKCLSTASYGEESSFTRPQMTPPSHNLLVTRQYCSFGSTTSNLKTSNIFSNPSFIVIIISFPFLVVTFSVFIALVVVIVRHPHVVLYNIVLYP